jgi:hypothetical protein
MMKMSGALVAKLPGRISIWLWITRPVVGDKW